MLRSPTGLLPLALAGALTVPLGLRAQTISGTILDAESGQPLGFSAVFVLDARREPVGMSAADVAGTYRVDLPAPGEYYLVVERLGYFETESPLLSAPTAGEFALDFELRAEPIRLDPLQVTVSNERLESFLELEFGQHPATMPGYRNIQGVRLEEARVNASDNTDFLRWLYIPVYHGRQVCIGTYGATPLPPRMSYERANARADAAAAPDDPGAQCGALYVDGYRCRNEHIESIELETIGVVVTVGSSVYMYTRGFDWTFRRGGGDRSAGNRFRGDPVTC